MQPLTQLAKDVAPAYYIVCVLSDLPRKIENPQLGGLSSELTD